MRCVAEVAPRVLPAVGTISSMTTQDATIRARGAVGTLRLWLMAHSDGGCGTYSGDMYGSARRVSPGEVPAPSAAPGVTMSIRARAAVMGGLPCNGGAAVQPAARGRGLSW